MTGVQTCAFPILEVVENLREAGIDVTLVQGSDHVMPPIDKEMAMMLHEHMTVKGMSETSFLERYRSRSAPDSHFPSLLEIQVFTILSNHLALSFQVFRKQSATSFLRRFQL